MQFVIWSFKHNAWWGPGNCGYTDALDMAGRYNAEEAGRIVVESVLLESVAILLRIAEDKGPPKYHPYKGGASQ